MLAIIGGGKVSKYINCEAKKKSISLVNFSKQKSLNSNSVTYKSIVDIKDKILDKKVCKLVRTFEKVIFKVNKLMGF